MNNNKYLFIPQVNRNIKIGSSNEKAKTNEPSHRGAIRTAVDGAARVVAPDIAGYGMGAATKVLIPVCEKVVD